MKKGSEKIMLKFIKGKKFRIIAIVVAVVVVISAVTVFVVDYYALQHARVTARFRVLEEGESFYVTNYLESTFFPDPNVQNKMFSMLSGFIWYTPPYSPYTPNSSDTYMPYDRLYNRFIIHITEDTRISFGASLITRRARNISLEDGQTLGEMLTDRKLMVVYDEGSFFGRGVRFDILPRPMRVEAIRIIVLDE